MGVPSRRLGPHPAERSEDLRCGATACPEVILIPEPGELGLKGPEALRTKPVVAVIGTLATEETIAKIDLPPGTEIADYERLVIVPEEFFAQAAYGIVFTPEGGGEEV